MTAVDVLTMVLLSQCVLLVMPMLVLHILMPSYVLCCVVRCIYGQVLS